MIMPAFDGTRLAVSLADLARPQQVAFGASCCERLLPSYRKFQEESHWGDLVSLRRALDAMWRACTDTPPDPDDLRILLEECEGSAPDSEDFSSLYTSTAQDAAFAVCSMLDFLLDLRMDALVRVGQYPTDSLDLLIQEEMSLDPSDPDLEVKILTHPLMQQELARQARDIEELRSDLSSDLLDLKARAQRESILSMSSGS